MSKLTKITAALAMLISPIAHGQQFVDLADNTESIKSSDTPLGGPAPQLFVVATGSSTVTVVDPTTNRVTTRIPVGLAPVRLAMTPNGLKAYVSNHGDDTVSVINTLNRIVTATIQVGDGGAQELTVTPDGGRVFVVHQDSGDVAEIDTATDTLIRFVTIGGTGAKDIVATPDSRFVYVANYTASMVNVINTSTNKVSNIATAAGPRRLAMTPGGDRVFATDYLGNSVSVIDTFTQTLIQNIGVGGHPRGITITPDGVQGARRARRALGVERQTDPIFLWRLNYVGFLQ